MKYHQIIHWDGNLRANNYAGSSNIIKMDDLVPVEGPKEFFSAAKDTRNELTEEINKAFPVVEQDGVTANSFIDTYLAPHSSQDAEEEIYGIIYAIQFYYIPAIDKE